MKTSFEMTMKTEDPKETTFKKIQEMRDDIRQVKESLEAINSKQHNLNTNQINQMAMCNLKNNFDNIQASQKMSLTSDDRTALPQTMRIERDLKTPHEIS